MADDCLPNLTVATALVGGQTIPVLPEPAPGVMHDIHVQRPTLDAISVIKNALDREDVRIFSSNAFGAANSRNEAIELATGDILLFCDSDIVQNPDAHQQLRTIFNNSQGLDLVCGRLHGPDGLPHKNYGASNARTRFWNSAKVGTPEIAIRTKNIKRLNIRFDPNFGAGTEAPLGDEYIFIMDCIRAGLIGRHLDLIMGVHPPISSGLNFGKQTLPWRRAVFERALGWYWKPVYKIFLMKNRGRLSNMERC